MVTIPPTSVSYFSILKKIQPKMLEFPNISYLSIKSPSNPVAGLLQKCRSLNSLYRKHFYTFKLKVLGPLQMNQESNNKVTTRCFVVAVVVILSCSCLLFLAFGMLNDFALGVIFTVIVIVLDVIVGVIYVNFVNKIIKMVNDCGCCT